MVEYKVFVSHSMRQEDLAIIYEVVRDAHGRGISCYIAERDPQLGKSLSDKLENAIRECDCFVVFLTKGGSQSAIVNQEIGIAAAHKKLRILVVEKGVQVRGLDIDKEYLPLDRSNPVDTISALNEYLEKLKAAKEEKQKAAVLILGAIALLGLLAGG